MQPASSLGCQCATARTPLAAERPCPLSIDIACPRGATQQHTRRRCCCRLTGQTDGRTLDRFTDPAPYTMLAVPLSQCFVVTQPVQCYWRRSLSSSECDLNELRSIVLLRRRPINTDFCITFPQVGLYLKYMLALKYIIAFHTLGP